MEMDVRFGTENVRRVCRSGSLKIAVRQLNYRLVIGPLCRGVPLCVCVCVMECYQMQQ